MTDTDEKISARLLEFYSQYTEALGTRPEFQEKHKKFLQQFLDLIEKISLEIKDPIERVQALNLFIPFLGKAIVEYAPGNISAKYYIYSSSFDAAEWILRKSIRFDLFQENRQKGKDKS